MEDILAIIFIFGGGTAIAIAFSPVGKAIAERLRGHKGELPASEDLDEIHDHLQALQRQVSELAERQDFTERLLAQAREKGALGSGTER